MTIKRKTYTYYDPSKLLSFNATYNFVVGGRGIGKTYNFKVRAVAKNLKNGEQFIYVRRYKEELKASKAKFFADFEHEFPNHDFRVDGYNAQYAPIETRTAKKREWFTMGFFIALSSGQTQKSVSFPNATTIIFDEFILEEGKTFYMNDEFTIFNNFYLTVDRYQDKTRVFFLANSVSIMNPYFLELDIRPDESSEYVKAGNGFVVAQFPDSAKFKSEIYESNFGKFIQGTNYAKYAVDNDFSDNHESLIGWKPPKARYIFSLDTDKGEFSVWHHLNENEFYIQEQLPKQQLKYTLIPANVTSDRTLMLLNDKPLQGLRTAFRHARVNFDRPSTRNSFAEIFKR